MNMYQGYEGVFIQRLLKRIGLIYSSLSKNKRNLFKDTFSAKTTSTKTSSKEKTKFFAKIMLE